MRSVTMQKCACVSPGSIHAGIADGGVDCVKRI